MTMVNIFGKIMCTVDYPLKSLTMWKLFSFIQINCGRRTTTKEISLSLSLMEFVCNANYKGDLHQSIDLIKLSQKLPNSKFHHKPCQLIVKDTKDTVIFF